MKKAVLLFGLLAICAVAIVPAAAADIGWTNHDSQVLNLSMPNIQLLRIEGDTVSISVPLPLNPGENPQDGTNNSSQYWFTTNNSNARIDASLNADMMHDVVLWVDFAGSPGTSHHIALSTVAGTVLDGFGHTTASAKTITYTLSATLLADPTGSSTVTRTVTYTLTHT